MTRKMVPMDSKYHNKLNLMAAAHHRSITAEAAFLVETAWNNYVVDQASIVQPPVNLEELANTDAE